MHPFVLHISLCGSEKDTKKLGRPIPTGARFFWTQLGAYGPYTFFGTGPMCKAPLSSLEEELESKQRLYG